MLAIIFLDIDGTLVNNKRDGLSPKTIKAFKALKENGHIPVVATGRIPYLCMDIFPKLEADSYVCANGSYIVYKGKEIGKFPIPKDLTEKVINYCVNNHLGLCIEFADLYVVQNRTEITDKFNECFHIASPSYDEEYYKNHDAFQFVICANSKKKELEKEFPELVFNVSNEHGLDVNLKGGLKEKGIKYLLDYLKYDIKETYAFGDGFNDIAMIKNVGIGIAMGNGNSILKENAKFVTLPIEYDAIYYTLKLYKLI